MIPALLLARISYTPPSVERGRPARFAAYSLPRARSLPTPPAFGRGSPYVELPSGAAPSLGAAQGYRTFSAAAGSLSRARSPLPPVVGSLVSVKLRVFLSNFGKWNFSGNFKILVNLTHTGDLEPQAQL